MARSSWLSDIMRRGPPGVLPEAYPLRARQQDHLKVADIRAGRSAADESAQAVEQGEGVVVVESLPDNVTGCRTNPGEGLVANQGAGRVGGAVDAVGSHTGHGRWSQRGERLERRDRKSTRLNSSHVKISYAVFCLKKKTENATFEL